MNKGKFIVLESMDGAGKGTVVERLKHDLPQMVFTRELGGTPFAEQVRNLMLESLDISSLTEQFLAWASRNDHVEKVILPNLELGNHVITERFTDSTLVYQVVDPNRPREEQKLFSVAKEIVTAKVKPDLIIILDVPYETSQKRMQGRELDKMESKQREFHDNIRRRLLGRASAHKNYLVIDATMTIDAVYQRVYNAIKDLLNEAK